MTVVRMEEPVPGTGSNVGFVPGGVCFGYRPVLTCVRVKQVRRRQFRRVCTCLQGACHSKAWLKLLRSSADFGGGAGSRGEESRDIAGGPQADRLRQGI